MDHVVYVDAKEKEFERIISGKQTMIIRGAAGRKLPYGRVNESDRLFFVRNNGEGCVVASAFVAQVFNSKKMTEEESVSLVSSHKEYLQLSDKSFSRCAGKRYIVLVTLTEVKAVEPFDIDRSEYGNMDDWLPVDEIERIKK